MRRLIHIPIIHGPEDFGAQLEAVQKAYLARYGLRAWQQHLRSVAQFWEGVRRALRPLAQQHRRFRIYQDGLPVCGTETELARQLAASGSANHRLIIELVEQGALLMGTEAPELLRQELERSRDALEVATLAASAPYDALMEARDRFIAARIDATLQAGDEVGLLFMGALHRVVECLPEDIQVTRLLGG